MFEQLLGKHLVSIESDCASGELEGSTTLIFTLSSGEQYQMWHRQDCCEDVYVESIVGDINDVLGSAITMAEVVTSNEDMPGTEYLCEPGDSFTWTFYKLGTCKGSVTIRWYGTSNGYYSEEVDFELMES